MDAEQWRRVDELLDAALGLPEREREPFVERAAAGDEALRDEVLSLLRAQSRAAGFMEQSALRVAARALAREAAPEPLAGREVGGYVVERLLGAGGMGEVYLARELKLGRPVAFKVLPRHALADPERAERFKREARALSALNHPNLVTVYDVGEHAGLAYIAMEYVEGRTLRSLLEDRPRLGESLAIAAQIAEALAAAHQAGVVHRDVKPDNVMVRPDGYVKLLDFGLAKLTEPSAPRGDGPGVTRAGAAMGTLAYMSPEQAAGEAVDHRTDIWSLGVLIYELVAGRKPFGGADRRATVNAIMSSEPACIPSMPPRCATATGP